MKLSPREEESLLVHQVGFLAQKRLARGVKLNYTEAVALIASQVQELIRDGNNSVADLMAKGREMLGTKQVQPGVSGMVSAVQVEGTFPDGTKLVTMHNPISRSHGDLTLALYGSFLPVPPESIFENAPPMEKGELVTSDETDADPTVVPGELIPDDKDVTLNFGKEMVRVQVTSVCDRPIQIGSHYHFIETNKNLIFDRELSYGKRLNIIAGTAVRFEPGETKDVTLVEISGNKVVRGGNGLCDGKVDMKDLPNIMTKVVGQGFGNRKQEVKSVVKKEDLICKVPRFTYTHIFGPTTGDKVRLGDTCLFIEVERDFTLYGDELKFGGGKVLREGMGQMSMVSNDTALDTVITNALIIDPVQGIIKADVGIKDGLIAGIGKAGNPDIMDGVSKDLVVGVGTEAIAGEGLILTAGAVDCHIHFTCPQLAKEAIASGITTMYGGGTGPATGTCATTCTPGPNNIKLMIQSTDAFPLNFGFTGKGNTSRSEGDGESSELVEQLVAGAIGFKIHEDWGSTPAAIDHCLRVAEQHDVQVMIHTDTLNESACVEQTLEAFKGRTIHTYHSEGAGGGHAPDIISVCGEPNILPSSTNPTRPYTYNTVDEHLDMLMVCHNLDKNLKEDVAFAESRIRNETMAAEDMLHDMGAISILSSDAHAMGRQGEVISRTWQTADKMKRFRGRLSDEKGDNDNLRVKRYLAKYTINPSVANGMGHVIGSIETGKMADLVLWDPAFFGAKPEIMIKGGVIAWAQMGPANASIPTPQPLKQRKQFGAYGAAVGSNSVIFVSQISHKRGIPKTYGINKASVPVKNCRSVKKSDMILNDYEPNITVDPQSYKVHITDENIKEPEHMTCPAANRLPLAQRYYLF